MTNHASKAKYDEIPIKAVTTAYRLLTFPPLSVFLLGMENTQKQSSWLVILCGFSCQMLSYLFNHWSTNYQSPAPQLVTSEDGSSSTIGMMFTHFLDAWLRPMPMFKPTHYHCPTSIAQKCSQRLEAVEDTAVRSQLGHGTSPDQKKAAKI